jgi:HD-GYP domain-containing protein (c-di-GMP phosphodiesterase class II)/DNA-binding CsgD family transcriptional regulator
VASAAVGAGDIRLADVFASLSLATDLGNGFPLEKALRNSLLATRLAVVAGMDERRVHDAYFAAMLRYIGCTALDYEMGSGLGDAAAARALFASLDMGRPGQAVPRALAHLGEGEAPARRAAILARFMRSGKRGGDRLVAADCEVVARFSARLRLGEGVAVPLAQMFERWDGKGVPAGLSGDAIEPVARVVHVAHAAEIHCRLGGTDEACQFLQASSGGWFDPALVRVFASHAGELFDGLGPESVWDAALAAEPALHRMMPAERLEDLTAAFADFIDLKSPLLLGHSSAVGRLAAGAAHAAALPAAEVTALRDAGRLHDLGRLSVANSVWDKAGPLSAAEWERVRLHAYYSERVLAASPVLAPLGRLAGAHHERLDGSGYHRGSSGSALPRPARFLAAADALAAMTEPRAHRPGRPLGEAAAELAAGARAGLFDRDAVAAVCEAGGAPVQVRPTWPAGLTDREVEVLRLLARGALKKQVAKRLGIGAGTVHTHVTHIYEKIGVNSRAAAALFAMEHQLLER